MQVAANGANAAAQRHVRRAPVERETSAYVGGGLPHRRRILGVVGDRYEPIQNAEAFSIADDLAGMGGARFESAGSLRNGKLVWLLAVLPQQSRVRDDVIDRYLLLTNPHDGSGAMQIMFTGVRVVCWNTLTQALRGAKTQASIWHILNRQQQIEQARQVLGLAAQYFDQQAAVFDRLASTPVEQQFVARFLNAVFPDPAGKSNTRAANTRERVSDLFLGGQQGADQEAARGTAYGLWNAVCEYADHERTVMAFNQRTAADARMDSILFGSASRLKMDSAALLGRVLGIEELDMRSARIDEMAAAFATAN